MSIIAFINQKGGVGKSILSFNIGAILSFNKKKVLFIDLDAQSTLTDMAIPSTVPYQATLFDVLKSKMDIKKAIVQAEHNSKYVHKSWIVIPEEKKKLIQDKYTNILNEIKYVGVITVEEGGKWTMVHRPFYRNKVELNQEILKLMLLKF